MRRSVRVSQPSVYPRWRGNTIRCPAGWVKAAVYPAGAGTRRFFRAERWARGLSRWRGEHGDFRNHFGGHVGLSPGAGNTPI
ncbi:hypothetical protein JRY29_07660 [Salmonella enterica subsp. enterica serovar Kentucky]|nr:hypothetical protein JRY29_07660 [Salmonella enterica subsp. enterica serovar Kentucky]